MMRTTSRVLIVISTLSLISQTPSSAAGQESAPPEAFIEWARQTAMPLAMDSAAVEWTSLQSLGALIGDARIVALSEGVHGGAEPLLLRNRFLEYLVTEKGFTAIAIESGLAEGRLVHDFVRGGPGTLDDVVARGFSWGFHHYPQNRALVEWLRGYNAGRDEGDMVDFYGLDVPGSPGNPAAPRGMRTGLEEALTYLSSVDPEAAARLELQLPSRDDYSFDPSDGRGYPLVEGDRNAVTAAIADLIGLLRRQESRYTRASSTDAFDWGLRMAIAARQADDWLRRIPRGWDMAAFQAGDTDPYAHGFGVRDRAQADNMRWIVEREGPAGKVLMFAANYHTSAAPIKMPTSADPDGDQVAGTYLKRWYGDDYFVVANPVRSGHVGCGSRRALPGLDDSSVAGALGQVGSRYFILDLRTARDEVLDWMNQEQALNSRQVVRVAAAFDALFHVDAVSPAC